MQCWEQAGIDLLVDRERATVAADAEEYEREHLWREKSKTPALGQWQRILQQSENN